MSVRIFFDITDFLATLEQIIQVTGSMMDSKCLQILIMIQKWYPTQAWDNLKVIQNSAQRSLTKIAGKLALLCMAYKYVIQQLLKNSMTKFQNHV